MLKSLVSEGADDDEERQATIDASEIRLGPALEDEAAIEAAAKLGASDWEVEPHLYKLVLYKGGYFSSHIKIPRRRRECLECWWCNFLSRVDTMEVD